MNMTKEILGKKIKALRKAKGLTQTELAGNKITRNMLSGIENGTSYPSLDTLEYIADGLGVEASYLLSAHDDLAFYQKKEKIKQIYRAYDAKNFSACIKIIKSITYKDNELYYILASSLLEVGKKNITNGALISAQKNLDEALLCCSNTKIDTTHIEAQIPLYAAIAKNVQSPLLEFDYQKYKSALNDGMDFEFFNYLTMDFSYSFETPVYRLHMEAKALIKERNYTEAVKRLLSAVELSKNEGYNAFVVFSLYTDLEYSYKQLYSYENAYLYSTKRMTLLEGFKS